MITALILILVGVLLFKLSGGLGSLFAIGMKILGVIIIISAVCAALGSI